MTSYRSYDVLNNPLQNKKMSIRFHSASFVRAQNSDLVDEHRPMSSSILANSFFRELVAPASGFDVPPRKIAVFRQVNRFSIFRGE